MTLRCQCGKIELLEIDGAGWVCASCFTRLNELYRRTLGEKAELEQRVRELETCNQLDGVRYYAYR